MLRTALTLAAAALLAAPAAAELPPLIPRDVLFGNPVKTAPQLSPDGKHLAYLAPDSKNVLQVWVQTVGQNDARAITRDEKRGIRQYYWAYDNKHLLYLQDVGGNEDFHLFATDLAEGKTRELTPYPGVRAQGIDLDEDTPGTVLVGLNKRNKAVFDMHRIDLATGKETLDTENPGNVVGWAVDEDFVVRGGTVMNADGSWDLLLRDAADKPWRKLLHIGSDDQGAIAFFGKDKNDVYVSSNHGANAVRLLKVDAATGKETVIAGDKQYDLSGVFNERKTNKPLAVSFTRARTEWTVLDDAVKADFEFLGKYARGDFGVVSRTVDDQTWLVAYNPDDAPPSFHVYDRKAKKAEFLFTTKPALEKAKLAQMEPVEYKAQDGLTIHGYLTKPVGVEAKNLPTVLLVHGGPWARDDWGYDGEAQWLANRGYAVLQVNFRGSTGYGKEFLNAGNREWAGKMHQDLIDAVNWIVKKGVADPKKVAIMGGSYGGYATLVGLTFTPDLFACGVDIVGPSSIVTLLKTIPPYWAPMKAIFTKRVGDLEKEEEFLNQRSPLYRADQITKPLLIGQGANDPRVKQAESDQIVKVMREKNKEVKYVLYPDEGHGFARPENRLHFYAIAEEFLAKHLGGRAEPTGEIKGTSGVVK
ncbi:MAG TPA: S9 family peptidase [Gemmataceae bacterium]|nr:S9 family peptidase [Gemmataceae bacterium]